MKKYIYNIQADIYSGTPQPVSNFLGVIGYKFLTLITVYPRIKLEHRNLGTCGNKT